MTSKERRKYINALSGVGASWIVASMSMPTKHMGPQHILLHKLVLRRKGWPAAQKH